MQVLQVEWVIKVILGAYGLLDIGVQSTFAIKGATAGGAHQKETDGHQDEEHQGCHQKFSQQVAFHKP